MAADLGAGRDEVQRAADAAMHFWFEAPLSEAHFAGDAALDSAISDRFGHLPLERAA
jgi:uncharacterized protein (DUF924 family)